MKKILTVVALLFTLVGYSQKNNKQNVSQLRLFKLEFKYKQYKDYKVIDTVPSLLKIGYRINRDKKPFIIDGYVVHTTRGVAYLDCENRIIPRYYSVKQFKF